MAKHHAGVFVLVCLVTLLSAAVASANFTVFLPFVSRMSTPTPTATPTPTPTATQIVGHYYLSGRVFFDYNGSGLQEEGEPGIQGVPLYVDSLGSALHATTGADGSYSISNVPPGAHQVYVQSPTQDPAAAFRYINLFKGWVDIPAYEMNGVQVPAQHLPDTQIQPLDWPLNAMVNDNTWIDVALMQGLLTLPFLVEQVPEPVIFGYLDIICQCFFDHGGKVTYENSKDGVVLSYDGRYNRGGDPFRGIVGVGDSHPALDYYAPVGSFIVSASPTSKVFYIDGAQDKQDFIGIWFEDPVRQGEYNATEYTHLDARLVQMDQRVYRGQILGLSLHEHNVAGAAPPPPTLHFDFVRWSTLGWWYFDPYRYTVQLNPLPGNFWGSEVSYWTKDNDPQFPRSPVPLPAPTPTATPITTMRIVTDGFANDWVGVEPVLEDTQGDSLGGADTDLVAAYMVQDDNDVCLMIRTAQNLNPQWTMLELMLDLRPGEVCGHRWELRTEVHADNTFSASVEDLCGTWNPVTVSGYTVSWRDVLEIRIPRSSLGANEFVRPTHTLLHVPGYQFWVDNMP